MNNPELENLTLTQLFNEVSDFHKDVFGYRPWLDGTFTRVQLIRIYDNCSKNLEQMSPEELANEGWF